ncbi:MAG TPA: 3'-5' exonuclease [Candidatus Paceibacterota bacterium]|nr:3'-5' exonuclease [Candidatus Paceibacterota bacterium]HPT17811.1 3'-5' exonuclease [Candidatus Paceibacterota bacterium]
MKKIIFFDTETTGNTEKDYLCQIAYKTGDESFVGFYKPPIKIPPEASAVHHITNKMVEKEFSFKESGDEEKIKKLFEDENSIVVAHNVQFDLMIIKKEGIKPKNFICTLRLARYLDPEGKIDRYNLQYLRYLLELDVEATAHDALGDVLVLEKLYERLRKKMMEEYNLNEEEVVEKMIEVSLHPSLLKYINFGKHNGKEIEEIARIDRSYLEWLLNQKLESDQVDEDWIYTLKHHLGK